MLAIKFKSVRVSRKNIQQLHLIRVFACLGVVLTHAKFALWSGGAAYLLKYPTATWAPTEYLWFCLDLLYSLGPQRVHLFFVLSGFFIAYATPSALALWTYYRQRLLRIYPAYLVSVLLSGLVLYLALAHINPALQAATGREYNVRVAASYQSLNWSSLGNTLLLFAQGEHFGFSPHYWSLAHELLFYLLFPVYHYCRFRGQLVLLFLAWVVATTTGNYAVMCQGFFLSGVLLYQVFAAEIRLPLLPNWSYIVACLALYVGIYLLSKTAHLYAASLLLLALVLVSMMCLLTKSLQLPRFIKWLSGASYAVYLHHFWVLLLYYSILSRVSGQVVFYARWPYYTGTLLAVLVPVPLHYLVQAPIQNYLRRKHAAPDNLPTAQQMGPVLVAGQPRSMVYAQPLLRIEPAQVAA